MTILNKKIAIPHGVIFVYDPTMIIDVPEDTSCGPILNTENCISIWTLHENDGESFLTLTDEIKYSAGVKIFEGNIRTDGMVIGFNDSSVNPIIEMKVSSYLTSVSIYTDGNLYPASVTCVINPFDTA